MFITIMVEKFKFKICSSTSASGQLLSTFSVKRKTNMYKIALVIVIKIINIQQWLTDFYYYDDDDN